MELLDEILFQIENFHLFRYTFKRLKEKQIRRRFYNDDYEYINRVYKNTFGKFPNLENPSTFNEKLAWEKLYWRSKVAEQCSDKYSVREFVKSRGCGLYLNELFGVYERIDDIDFLKLPESFVLKTTNDSGGVFLCKNKNDKEKLEDGISKIRKYYSMPEYNLYKEWVYYHPEKRIICESLIRTNDQKAPKDYKIFCFNGEPAFLFVASDRETTVKFDFFDLSWNHLNVKNGHKNSKAPIEKPANLDEMLNVARKLSKGFPHVRVDLYNENGNIIFGELTFFHFAGNVRFYPNSFDEEMGKKFDLSMIPSNEIIGKPVNHK